MRSTGTGTCYACRKTYSVGDLIAQDGMAEMGTPRQRWLIRHATCAPSRAAAETREVS